ncbi:hypothetical protein [Rhodovibrio sodomensis]|nr:hypothetical protein [Rhodovibrio sodomensis]
MSALEALLFIAVFMALAWVIAKLVQVMSGRRIDAREQRYYTIAGGLGLGTKIVLTSLANSGMS